MSLLREALDVIRDKNNWCTETSAVDENGVSVRPHNPQATKWCASGAMQKAFYTRADCTQPPQMKNTGLVCDEWSALNEVARTLFPQYSDDETPIIVVNDNEGHEAVIQCFEKAIVETEGSL